MADPASLTASIIGQSLLAGNRASAPLISVCHGSHLTAQPDSREIS